METRRSHKQPLFGLTHCEVGVHVVLPVNLWAGLTIPSGKISFVCVLCMAPSPALRRGPHDTRSNLLLLECWVGIMALTEPWV